MKTIAVFAAIALLTGCASLTPTQRKVAYAAGAVAATAIVIGVTNGRSPSYCGDGRSFCGPIKP